MTTNEFRGRLAGVREGLDSVLDSLNDLEGRTWEEIDEGDCRPEPASELRASSRTPGGCSPTLP